MDKKEYYYPYCGYVFGFCTKGSDCPFKYEEIPPWNSEECDFCSYWILRHPVSNNYPQYIYSPGWTELLNSFKEEDDTD